MTAPRHQHLWFDLETTGLIPEEGLVLEWALALAEDDRGGSFEIVQEYTGVVHHPAAKVEEACDARVTNMHTKNGLLAEVAASTTSLEDVDTFLQGVCQDLTGKAEPRGLELAGFSPHFDLAWVKVHLPKFAHALSHRVFNVSTLRRVAQVHFPEGALIEQQNPDRHRALDDVRASITYTRDWLAAVGLV